MSPLALLKELVAIPSVNPMGRSADGPVFLEHRMTDFLERWFRDLTEKAIRRGSFHSVAELESSIWEYIEASNENPRPFSWTAQPDKILAKVAKARAALDKVQD